MRHTIFLSWQSDTPNGVGRTMIEACLADAIKAVRADAEVKPADREIAIDKDTAGVPGSPAIAETIYRKIDSATVFLSDLTYVALRPKGGGIPNPNVSVEHGWALRAVGSRRVISVMNTAMGHPDEHDLPFDLRHVRRPILYDCAEGADPPVRAKARKQLAGSLAAALQAIFSDEAILAEMRPKAPEVPHPHDVELLARVRRQLPAGLRRFLSQHGFGTPFRISTLEPIHDMNEAWIGSGFEFHDTVLQDAFAAVRLTAAEFGSLVLERIFPMDNDPRLGTSRTQVDRSHGIQDATVAGIRLMEASAAELGEAIDAFDRVARDRIRVASGAHVEPSPPGRVDDRIGLARMGLDELAASANRGAVPILVGKPRLTLRLVPLAAMEGRRLDAAQVGDAQLRFPPSVDAAVQTGVDETQWWSCAVPRRQPGLPNEEASWLMRLARPGCLEYQVQVGERIDDDRDILIDGRHLRGADRLQPRTDGRDRGKLGVGRRCLRVANVGRHGGRGAHALAAKGRADTAARDKPALRSAR